MCNECGVCMLCHVDVCRVPCACCAMWTWQSGTLCVELRGMGKLLVSWSYPVCFWAFGFAFGRAVRAFLAVGVILRDQVVHLSCVSGALPEWRV